ncbi:MAG: HNH endonuclease [Elusimicrobiota bacterium]|nr:MAG: HNH endonuclease [Elusimicrobiota bacterium]
MNDDIHPLEECEKLSDKELVQAVRFLADRAKHNELRLLAHLAEFDSRRLCLEEGQRSAYDYCLHVLGFDEQEAYRRIRAARIIRSFPEACAALASRRVTISALVVLSPWLQKDNVAAWMKAAEGRSKRDLEALVASRYPQADQPDHVRNLAVKTMIVSSAPPRALEAGPAPASGPGTNGGEGGSMFDMPGEPVVAVPVDGGPPQLIPIGAARVRVGFDAPSVLGSLLERMRQLLRHKYPEGRLEDLVREALEDYLDRKDPERRLARAEAKSNATAMPAPEEGDRLPTRFLRAWAGSRYIPAKVKSEVWARDDGRCAWRDADGTVCGSRDWIEYDHVRPFARGGRSDDARNLRLVCRQHNQAAALAAGFSAGPPPS